MLAVLLEQCSSTISSGSGSISSPSSEGGVGGKVADYSEAIKAFEALIKRPIMDHLECEGVRAIIHRPAWRKELEAIKAWWPITEKPPTAQTLLTGGWQRALDRIANDKTRDPDAMKKRRGVLVAKEKAGTITIVESAELANLRAWFAKDAQLGR